MSYSVPTSVAIGDKTYCTWEWSNYETPYNAGTFAGHALHIPQSTFAPDGKTIFIDQAFVLIWGVQKLNGGWVSAQVWHPDIASSTFLACAFDGQITNNMHHAYPGVPMRPQDDLLMETQYITYAADYSPLWNYVQSTWRAFSIDLRYHYTT